MAIKRALARKNRLFGTSYAFFAKYLCKLYTAFFVFYLFFYIVCDIIDINLIWKMILKEQMMVTKRIVLIFTRVCPKWQGGRIVTNFIALKHTKVLINTYGCFYKCISSMTSMPIWCRGLFVFIIENANGRIE